MFSYFTELNRKRPPIDLVDLMSFTTCALVHAGDDHSVIEGLESLPHIAASARKIAGERPWAVGPGAIGMRMNPYGEAPMENPGNIRQAMNFNDPRQRGLLGAAWMLAYYALFAKGGAEAITVGAAAGAFGIVHSRQSWPQPWFDEQGGVYPAYHVVRGLAGLAGNVMRKLEISAPGNTPSLEDVRDKIERRYADALGSSELAQGSMQGRMAEIQQASVQMAGHSRLQEIRASMQPQLPGRTEQAAVTKGESAEAAEPGESEPTK